MTRVTGPPPHPRQPVVVPVDWTIKSKLILSDLAYNLFPRAGCPPGTRKSFFLECFIFLFVDRPGPGRNGDTQEDENLENLKGFEGVSSHAG